MPKGKGKGQGMKGDQMLKTDTAGEIYEKSTWAIKTSERSVVGAMPLLSEFARFANWETEAKRRKNRLYNHPVSHIIEYFIINFKNSVQTVGRTASDYLKRQLGKKVEKSEKLMLGNKEFERIGFDWMFTLLKEKFEETQAQGIIKLSAQLGEMNQVVYQELDECIRDPEGVWDWLSKKRDDLQSLGRNLTNREMFDYFTKCKIAMECEYVNVIKRHCYSIDFLMTLRSKDGATSRKNLLSNYALSKI